MDVEPLLSTPRFRVVRKSRTTSGGTMVSREVIEHPGAVAVAAVDEDGHVVLIRNHRLAVGTTLIEIPAGTLAEGETPLEAARRELAEETGYRAESWRLITQLWMSPGILRERMHVYHAAGLRAGTPSPEETEEIEVFRVPWERALAMVGDGSIQDAKTVAALLFLDRETRET
jgi:ADP-ribose pyrophosphatase